MYFLYTFIYTIVIIFLLPFEFFKRPRDLRRRWLREKFGSFDSEFNNSPGLPFADGGRSGVIWVHAVSVGEVIAASPLIKKIRERYPSKEIVLSTITDTGQKVARERTPGGTRIVYLPFDIPTVLNSVLMRASPELLIIIETELWPNMFRIFGGGGVPIVLLNGRISEKSFRGYKMVSFFMRKVLSHVNFFGMQGEAYADRIRSLGVDDIRVKTLGNLKFDLQPPSLTPAWAAKLSGPVITAGSTHEGEEELMASLHSELKKDFPDLNLVIAPRHPERFKGVEEMLRSRGLPFVKRSSLDSTATEAPAIKGLIILLDTMGELSSVYGVTDIAIIGKSFNGYGGQNPLEPASWGRPVICGPHMENFPVIRDFYKAGAALEANQGDLYAQLKRLLLCPDEAKAMGLKARELYRKNSGAADRAMEVISNYIS
jgi:3-deoxy-D-manno-octulosonic-acid transferase